MAKAKTKNLAKNDAVMLFFEYPAVQISEQSVSLTVDSDNVTQITIVVISCNPCLAVWSCFSAFHWDRQNKLEVFIDFSFVHANAPVQL
jgi:hypothetical protein